MAAEESYPDELKYHREHDWARIEGDEADARDHLVRAGLARRARPLRAADGGQQIQRGASYGEVESVKAVSDVIAPLSGEVLEVNRKAVDEPETVNADPYGEGWLIRIRLSEPAEADELLDAGAYRAVPGRAVTPFVSLTERDEREMLDAIGVSSVDELFRDVPEGVRFRRELALDRALSEPEVVAHLEELAATERDATRSRSSARGSTTTTSPRSSTRSCSAASSSRRTRRTSRR